MNAESKKLQMNTSRSHVTDDFFADQGMSLEAQLHQPVSLPETKGVNMQYKMDLFLVLLKELFTRQ
jgi:hypothetical protein